MAAKKNQLSVLIPDRSFDTSIGDLVLKPFKFKQFQIALEIIEKYIKAIFIGEMPDSAKSDQEEDEEKDEEKTVITTASIINFLLEKSDSDDENYAVLEDIAYLLKLVSGKDVEQIQELTYDEVFALLSEVIDQNIDFFSRIGKKINPGPVAENGETPEVTTGESESLG